MEPISVCLAVLSTVYFSWLGYKYQERTTDSFLLIRGAKKEEDVRVQLAPDFGLLARVLFSMVFLAVVIGLKLTL